MSWPEHIPKFTSNTFLRCRADKIFCKSRGVMKNQDGHHRKKTFREEYLDFLKKFDVPYDERYLFDWME